MPIGLTLLFLMARRARCCRGARRQHRAAARPAVLAGVVRRRPRRWSPLLSGADGCAALLAFGLGGFAAGAALRQLVLAHPRQGWRGLVGRANGGMIVHLGVIIDRRRARRVEQLHDVSRAHAAGRPAGRRTPGTRSSLDAPWPRSRTPARPGSRADVAVDGGQVYAPGAQPLPELRRRRADAERGRAPAETSTSPSRARRRSATRRRGSRSRSSRWSCGCGSAGR